MPNAAPTPQGALALTHDIAILGAGMVGSALACGLADLGYRVVIFDRQPPAEFQADAPPSIRVSALSLASEQLLNELGALKHLRAMRSCPYRRLAVWEDNRATQPGTWFDCHEIGMPSLGSIVENEVTQKALHTAMGVRPGIQLHCPASITEVRETETGVELKTDQGNVHRVLLVIGADGAFSQVRQWAHIGQTTNQYEQQAMVITVEYEGVQEDITWQEFHPTGPIAFLPLADVVGRHYASLVWYHQPDEITRLMTLSKPSLIQAITETYPKQLPPIKDVIETGRFPLVKRHALHYFKGRFVLAGDAAHTINPLAGQGVNLGFQDVRALTQILAEAKAAQCDPGLATFLSRYEKERRPQNTQMMQVMDLFYHTFSNSLLPIKHLRNLGLFLANRLPLAKQEVLKYAIGVKTPPRSWVELHSLLPF